jgi:hypothetical protein
MTTSTSSKSSPSYEAIKLGIDAHAKYYWVSRQVDGATPFKGPVASNSSCRVHPTGGTQTTPFPHCSSFAGELHLFDHEKWSTSQFNFSKGLWRRAVNEMA